MGADRIPTSTQPEHVPPRLRFAKREIQRALTALEAVQNNPDVDWAIRCFEAEQRLEDQREETKYWRESYQAMAAILRASGEERAELIERLINHGMERQRP